ncbi:hypothetical protein ACHAXA_009115 [Cyclostephanos tholiformis]|uniref:Nudix hydrolase domain-containing protein n=1 Tax=Cyclostephanos tholiformis TaxID=382380 RepID=A0ABD3RXH0_9STRA
MLDNRIENDGNNEVDEGRKRVKFFVEEGGAGGGVDPPPRRYPRMSNSNINSTKRADVDGILVALSNRHYHADSTITTRGQGQRTLLWRIAAGLAIVLLCRSFLTVDVSPPDPPPINRDSSSSSLSSSSMSMSMSTTGSGTYRGMPWHNERTVSVETLRETNFARCDVHAVLGEDGTSVISDWIFLEEMPAVNVIVHTLEGKYVVFKQRKYAIPGETLSPVGGFIDVGESPNTAAKREVLEELGLGSRRTLRAIREEFKGEGERYDNGRSIRGDDDPRGTTTLKVEEIVRIISDNANPPVYDNYGLMDGFSRSIPNVDYDADWVYLGRYRTAANRGGGFLYSYLLTNAVPLVPGGGTINYNGNGDDEDQSIILLDEDDVIKALAGGKFQEVKWAATFALAMLHIRGGMPACCGSKTE